MNLYSNGYIYAPFDERKYPNRDGSSLKNQTDKKKKKEEEEEEEEESSLSAAQNPPTPGWEVNIEPEVELYSSPGGTQPRIGRGGPRP